MKVVIVFNHPYERSYCNALLKAVIAGLQTAGHETDLIHLDNEEFDPVMRAKDLKGFKKVFLQPGEKKEVSFTVTTQQLKFYNSELKYDWEPGEFIIQVGTNSSNTKSAKLQWEKAVAGKSVLVEQKKN